MTPGIHDPVTLRSTTEPVLRPGTVRAAGVCLVNGWCRGHAPVRRVLALDLVRRLNTPGGLPDVEARGSMGASDLIQMAQLTSCVLDDGFALGAGEGMALVSSNAVSVARAIVATARAARVLQSTHVAVGLTLEAMRGNLSPLSVDGERFGTRHPPTVRVMRRLRGLMDGSALSMHERGSPTGPARVQDSLTLRDAACVLGAAADAVTRCRQQLEVAANHCHTNPVIVPGDAPRGSSVPAYDTSHLCVVVDSVRQALSMVAGSSAVRSEKLTDNVQWTPGTVVPYLYRRNITYHAHFYAREAAVLSTSVAHLATASVVAEGCEDLLAPLPHSVQLLEQQVVAVARAIAIEACVAVSVLHKRLTQPRPPGLVKSDLAPALRPVFDALEPLCAAHTPPDEVYALAPFMAAFEPVCVSDADPTPAVRLASLHSKL